VTYRIYRNKCCHLAFTTARILALPAATSDLLSLNWTRKLFLQNFNAIYGFTVSSLKSFVSGSHLDLRDNQRPMVGAKIPNMFKRVPMKTLFTITCLLICCYLSAQTIDHILFDYDAAGNQIKRYVVDITPGKETDSLTKNIEELTEADLIEADIYNDIKYYPNPVKEQLYVRWTNLPDLYVTGAELFSLSGQSIEHFKIEKGSAELTVAFEKYPQGLYTLVLVYSNAERKTLKIIKG
jgi:hypothetical protein